MGRGDHRPPAHSLKRLGGVRATKACRGRAAQHFLHFLPFSSSRTGGGGGAVGVLTDPGRTLTPARASLASLSSPEPTRRRWQGWRSSRPQHLRGRLVQPERLTAERAGSSGEVRISNRPILLESSSANTESRGRARLQEAKGPSQAWKE